jgi:hypothetical protein
MLHCKMLVPVASPVMEVTGEAELAMVPVPLRIDQRPVPTVGVFALRVTLGLFEQMIEPVPAIAGEGSTSMVMITESRDGLQNLSDTIQVNILLPDVKPLIVVS